jgi:hypothetical protein
MVRVVIFVIAIVGIFAGALVYGGERLGAWDQAEPPPPSNLQPITRPQEKNENEDGESGPPAPPTKVSPDKAGWIRETNALCRRAREDMSDYEQPQTLAEFETVLTDLQAKNRQYNNAFAAIRPAKGDERRVAKLLALFDRDERLVSAVLTAVRQGDAGALVELNERLALVAEQESELLVGLGATDCSLGLLGTAY